MSSQRENFERLGYISIFANTKQGFKCQVELGDLRSKFDIFESVLEKPQKGARICLTVYVIFAYCVNSINVDCDDTETEQTLDSR